MARLAYYAGASTALAAGVVISAFHQRANFYSACVYLAQSNLCLMILINLILLIYCSFMYGLQRLCYGPLRPIETEQLYEKAWFAITETCLAMTIFRDEVGAWFLVMFVALLTGKVWGWIGDGRVEVLEQQPPANPRLFHIRLSISLAMSVLYDLWLMNHAINAVIQQARPNMMVMFLFEFAILTTSCLATGFRYGISLIEAKVVKKQTQERLVERRREVRNQRDEMIREREEAARAAAVDGGDPAPSNSPLPSEDDVDEMDIEVPGWESKGLWVLTLDLVTDLVKFLIYVAFFLILLMFYGLPIHIIHNLFLTARSFMKRLAAFIKYRRATHDMNSRYEDATVEDIQREDTCIICREEMRPWSVTNPQALPAEPGALPPARPPTTVNERSRPKKLPCGHILHLGCLKSWLERQQVCPTCRRPVVDAAQAQTRGAANNANPAGQGAQAPRPDQQDGAGAQPPAAGGGNRRRLRVLNLGPLRVGFGQANLQDLAQDLGAAEAGQENGAARGPRVYGLELRLPRRERVQPPPPAQGIQGTANATNATNTANTVQDQLQQIEQQIVADIRSLQTTQQEFQLVQLLQAELARLRLVRIGGADPLAANFQIPQAPQMPPMPQLAQYPSRHTFSYTQPPMQRHGTRSTTSAIPSGSADLPPGVTIPEGWSLLPLERLDGLPRDPAQRVVDGVAPNVPVPGPSTNVTGLVPTATTTSSAISPMVSNSNNIPTPTPTINPDNHSQASSVNSSDTNAIPTPPSMTASQSVPSIPTTTMQTTTAGESFEATAPLPSWGNSPLFSANGNTQVNVTRPAAPPPPSAQRRTAETVPGPSRNENEEDESSGEDLSGDERAEKRMVAKGKAKAVSMEDVKDEAEGS